MVTRACSIISAEKDGGGSWIWPNPVRRRMLAATTDAPPASIGDATMRYLVLKAGISAILIVTDSEIATRSPAFGVLIATRPFVPVLGMVCLWHDTSDFGSSSPIMNRRRLGTRSPSLPMFLLIPALLPAGAPFWLSLRADNHTLHVKSLPAEAGRQVKR
ncbi:MAG: DUF3147 family protein [Parvularculaceae bacterium]|nr:DUF3147 family protein [Parvularculaceae bacterium]